MTPFPYVNNTDSLAEQEVWRYLRLYCTTNQCRTLLNNIPDLSVDEKYKRIAMIQLSLVQAEEFFAATDRVSVYTSPLLLYYGILSLTRCIMSIKTSNIDNVFNNHGAMFKYGNSYFNSSIIIRGYGVIPSLIKTLSGNMLEAKDSISIEYLLSLLPHVEHEYFATYDKPQNIIWGKKNLIYNSYVELNPEDRYLECKSILESIPSNIEPKDWYTQNDHCIEIANPYKYLELKILQEYLDRIYFSFGLKTANANHIWLSQCEIIFLLLFALSMLVRYHPIEWDSLIGHRLSRERQIIERLILISKKYYPLFVFDLFNKG